MLYLEYKWEVEELIYGEDQMKVLCISASNILHSRENSISKILCSKISGFLKEKGIMCETVDLKEYVLHPCIGCGKCFINKRCYNDTDFNIIYEKVIEADLSFLFLRIMLQFLLS